MAERKRKGLGRGLDSLIPVSDPSSSGFLEIPLDHINPNPSQPRTRFDEDGMESLSASIKEVGVLQPVVVRASDGGYELVAGERRWRAARMAGLTSIPAVVREPDEEGWSRLTEALIENVQREDLGPLEEAAAYRQLMEDFGWTHEEVGQHVAKSRSTITNQIRLLQLPAAIQGLLERGELTAGHAKALVGLEDEAYAAHIAQRAAKDGWSVRMVEDAVRARTGEKSEPRGARAGSGPVPHAEELTALEERLAERLEAPVDISLRGKNGKLTVKFQSLDELERIYRTMFGP